MSPRSSEQNEKIREERIGQIMEAALSVYLEKGVHGMDMRDVANRAQMARGLIYYYFKDKMELLRAMFQRYMDEAHEYISTTLSSDVEVIDKLKEYVRFFLISSHTKPDMVRFYLKMQKDIPLVFVDDAPSVLEQYLRFTREPMLQALTQGVREGKLKDVDPQILTSMYWGGISGGMNVFMGKRISGEEAERRIDEMVDLLFDGLLSHKKEP